MLTSVFTIKSVKAWPKIWTVNSDGSGNFTTIQEAINTVNLGDYIYVINGTYNENVDVNKTVWLVGEKQEITVIDGGGTETVVNITANNVVLSNFTIQNSGNLPEDAGIRLEACEGCVINKINLTGNICHIALVGSNNNLVLRNIIQSGTECGLNLTDSDNNHVAFNKILSNEVGVHIGLDSSGNNLTRNEIKLNTQCGILANSSGNFVFHNILIDNAAHVLTDSINVWDNGDPSGGNYWSGYTGTDPDGDGLGNTPYVIDVSNQDNHPLIRSPDLSLLSVDLNDDRTINMRDIGEAAQAFGGYPNGPRWNFLADVNGDLRVDLRDIAQIVVKFGMKYP